jgi:glutathione synthase/RimK-type ligase-like ATP-grasp enzyme/gamma-glutamyl:cysteine ligase YbdK (ATP-grasp superfamily)
MSGSILIVVSDLADVPELRERAIAADQYLTSGGQPRDVTVVNLCRSYRYRSKGYYVSLVADARGHRVLPAVETLEELSEPFGLFRVLREAGIPTLDVAEMKGAKAPPAANGSSGDAAETLVIFGHCREPHFQRAARATYRAWPIPLMRLRFARRGDEWWVANAEPVPLKRLTPPEHAELVRTLSMDGQAAIEGASPPMETKRASVAVLFDEEDPFTPSTPETIEHLERVAAGMNVYVHRLGLDEIDRLPEYDALFIRSLTGVREPAFQFALRAEMLDMPVIDDPQSIIRCSNKVFLEELLRREGVPTPRTMIIAPRTPWREVTALGVPFVVKLPDGSFSSAVHKIENERDYGTVTADMFRRSPLLIAQEFLSTEFDWRVTLLDGQVLFTARYYMAAGHWQIRDGTAEGEQFGRVEAVPRERAPRAVLDLARRAATWIGRGLYGVDIKEGPSGPVVIEINDNPNLDRGDDDTADGDLIYRDILDYFLRRIEERPRDADGRGARGPKRKPSRHYRPFSVAGMELEYAVVDENLEPVSHLEAAFRAIAGRSVSEVDFGGVAFSNEIADHVFEVKTPLPSRSLARAEEALVTGVRRFAEVLDEGFGARLLPTGMHPWFDPVRGRLWRRSGARIYQAYSRIFDLGTHGWMNVHAAHLNLPMGRGPEAVAMYNASALVIPYLPALAASSPMHDGRLQPAEDSRMEWIFRHQAKVPESQGEILPEFVLNLTDYRRRILQPMYRALEAYPGSEVLRHDFFNARGAVLKFSRRALEIRAIDMQECVRMDIAIAVFVRSLLRYYTRKLLAGKLDLPPRQILLGDFRATIRSASGAYVVAPHLGDQVSRDDEGRAPVRECLRNLLSVAEKTVRKDEAEYLPLVAAVIEQGSLAEAIRARLQPHADDPAALRDATRMVYGELADCLIENVPWSGRGR